jgi:hypothetical protein
MVVYLPQLRTLGAVSVCSLYPLFALAPAAAETPSPAARAHCAAYGSDYVATSGGERCVRIGGHVRAEMAAAAAPPSLIGAPAGFARAIADGVNNVSQSLQVRPGAPMPLYRR